MTFPAVPGGRIACVGAALALRAVAGAHPQPIPQHTPSLTARTTPVGLQPHLRSEGKNQSYTQSHSKIQTVSRSRSKRSMSKIFTFVSAVTIVFSFYRAPGF